MPLYKKILPDENSILAIWKINESKEELLQLIDERLLDVSKPINAHDDIGKHWLASRALLLHVFKQHKVEIHKDSNNKPSLVVDDKKYFIAITHSHDYAAVMISDEHEVGLDMEKIDMRISRVAHKFINEDEEVFVNKSYADDLILYQTIIWSAKETMYKIYGKKGLDFKKHMSLCSFELNANSITGKIHKNDEVKQFSMQIEFIHNYVLCYGILKS